MSDYADYRVVDGRGIPLDDDREEWESPEEWLRRWQTVEGWPEAQLERRDGETGEWAPVLGDATSREQS